MSDKEEYDKLEILKLKRTDGGLNILPLKNKSNKKNKKSNLEVAPFMRVESEENSNLTKQPNTQKNKQRNKTKTKKKGIISSIFEKIFKKQKRLPKATAVEKTVIATTIGVGAIAGGTYAINNFIREANSEKINDKVGTIPQELGDTLETLYKNENNSFLKTKIDKRQSLANKQNWTKEDEEEATRLLLEEMKIRTADALRKEGYDIYFEQLKILLNVPGQGCDLKENENCGNVVIDYIDSNMERSRLLDSEKLGSGFTNLFRFLLNDQESFKKELVKKNIRIIIENGILNAYIVTEKNLEEINDKIMNEAFNIANEIQNTVENETQKSKEIDLNGDDGKNYNITDTDGNVYDKFGNKVGNTNESQTAEYFDGDNKEYPMETDEAELEEPEDLGR
ncbi:MAG: hypothetical protein HUJ68_04445 [Clostridia bacterium]|nr:hypothetical protein [Clostridia bacterium]